MFLLISTASVGGAVGLTWRFRKLAIPATLAAGLVVGATALVAPPDPFGVIRALSWTGLLFLPAGLVGLAAIFRVRWLAVIAGVAALASAAFALDAFVVEPAALEVARYTLHGRVKSPLRIALLTDIQTDHPGERERDVFARVNAEQVDLILFGGDYVQATTLPAQHALEGALHELLVAAALRAPLGAYAVRGNVDVRGWTSIFEGTGVQATDATRTWNLRDDAALTALSFEDGFDTHARVPPAPDGRFHLVLAHSPDFSLGNIAGDLLFAGHTHGGQIQLPFFGPPVTLTHIPRAQAAGGMFPLASGPTLVVSRGIGMERGFAPRYRFNCRPQLVFVDVVPD